MNKRLLVSSALGILLVFQGPNADAQNNELNWTIDRAVRQLDRQGEDFETVLSEAEITWSGAGDTAERELKGRIYMDAAGGFRLNVEAPETRTVLVRNRRLYDYDPATSTVTEYNLSRDNSRLEVFLPLGFSTTGKDMEREFLITYIGDQTMNDRRTLGLELTPKSNNMRNVIGRIEMWMDQASWLPVKQVIKGAGGGPTMTATYSGTARNLSLNPDLFKDQWPRGTKKVRP